MSSAFDEEIKLVRKWEKKNPRIHREFAEWRRVWRVRGPVSFAHKVLKIDPVTGKDLLLSEDQQEFLLDMSKRGVRLAIITAGRGAGKTFVLAVYIMWRIFTHDYWGISSMGGSAEQSDKIHQFISGWVRDNKIIREYCMKCIKKKVATFSNSYCSFHSCSATSVRGPHTYELIIDEQASGEERGGTKQIKAAIWQVSTSPDIHIIKSSTAQWVHGDFLNTWTNADKLGYKKYNWAIAKHVSGVEDPYLIYQDHNPDNWLSNVPWIPDLNITILRNDRSNDEWLVEALGGISKSSGLVFNPADVDSNVCSRCLDDNKPCRPYAENHCPIIQYYMQLEGIDIKKIPISTRKALQKVGLRIQGIDWGKNSPCAYSAVGKLKRMVFVLHSEEEVGASDDEKIQKGIDIAKKWHIEIIRPDPREWSFNNTLADAGFAIHELFGFEGGQEKNTYLHTIKKLIERHKMLIPCAFEDLIRSLKNLTYDKDGKVRKVDDHSFDSLLYAVSFYGEIDDQSGFWKAMKKKKMVYKAGEKKELPEGVVPTNDPDVVVIPDVVDFLKKRKWERERTNEDEEFPWGEGVEW